MAPSNSPTHRLAQWPKGESETLRCRSVVEDWLQSRLPELVELFYFVQPPLGATASYRWFKTGHLWFMWYWPCIIQQSKLLCHLTEQFAVYEKKRFQVFDVEKLPRTAKPQSVDRNSKRYRNLKASSDLWAFLSKKNLHPQRNVFKSATLKSYHTQKSLILCTI